MNLSNLNILWSETAPVIGIYAIYALVVCSVIQYIEYRNERSRLGFTGILTGNITIFFTALILFTLAMAGYWYGLQIFKSHVIFAFFAAFAFCGSVLGISILMQKVTGLILKSPMRYASFTAFSLSIPLFIAAVFAIIFSLADFRH